METLQILQIHKKKWTLADVHPLLSGTKKSKDLEREVNEVNTNQ